MRVIITLLVLLSLNSCELTKKLRGQKSEEDKEAKVSKASVDSSKGGYISKETNKTKEEFDWYKMTQLFDQNKQKPGETKVYPTAVIYEGGKGTKESETTKFDSTFFQNLLKNIYDSLGKVNSKAESNSKDVHRESKGLGWWLFVIIAVGAIIVYEWLTGKFKIVKDLWKTRKKVI